MTTNSKAGREVSKDPAPGLPVAGGTIFGNSPVRRAPITRHLARADSGTDDPQEQENLRQASSPTSAVES